LNNAQLSGSDLEFNAFVPQNGIGFWFRNTSDSLLSHLAFLCEASTDEVTVATCLKTDPGVHIQGRYDESVIDPGRISDSISPGTLIPYAWDYARNGTSQGQATAQGILLIPNGTGAGYACGPNCGAVNLDTNTQLPGTYPHIQFPPNMGNGTWTFAMEQSANTFTQTLIDTSAIRSAVVTADQGVPCTNAELTLRGWGGGASVSGAVGTGQTCEWTITAGAVGRAFRPTITDQLTNPLPTGGVVCDMRMVGGTGANTLIDQIQLSATNPVFMFNGIPGVRLTYKILRRCGP